jgi:hypothetical protein
MRLLKSGSCVRCSGPGTSFCPRRQALSLCAARPRDIVVTSSVTSNGAGEAIAGELGSGAAAAYLWGIHNETSYFVTPLRTVTERIE